MRRRPRQGEVVIVAVPWEGHRGLLVELASSLADKIVVDCVNPIGFDTLGPYPLTVEEGSASRTSDPSVRPAPGSAARAGSSNPVEIKAGSALISTATVA